MIHIIYPNSDNENFICAVTYLAFQDERNDEIRLNGYDVPKNVEIESLADSFIGSKPISRRYIYEFKDTDEPCFGRSQGLAYLFILINQAIEFRWEKDKDDYHIWCTGEIEDKKLAKVTEEEFDNKLNGFIKDTKANLFIVPESNIKRTSPEILKELENNNIRILSIGNKVKKKFSEKIILKVKQDEIEQLINIFFKLPEPKTKILACIFFALFLSGLLLIPPHPDTPVKISSASYFKEQKLLEIIIKGKQYDIQIDDIKTFAANPENEDTCFHGSKTFDSGKIIVKKEQCDIDRTYKAVLLYQNSRYEKEINFK